MLGPQGRCEGGDRARKSKMTPQEYRSAISSLGLSQLAAGRWLCVSPKTAQRYATEGPSGPASVAIRMALLHGLTELEQASGSNSVGMEPRGRNAPLKQIAREGE